MLIPASKTIHRVIRRHFGPVVLALFLACVGQTVQAQTFSSGSTGADGAFAPTSPTTVQVPESGVFNFTTVTIIAGADVTFKRNSRNTPVIILATGDVKIDGNIFVEGFGGLDSGGGGQGGPGGFDGGAGGVPYGANVNGGSGNGPGGGGAGIGSGRPGGGAGFAAAGAPGAGGTNPAAGGARYGSKSLQPLIGGSGGGGGAAATNAERGGAGGGGGGAILIASSTTITGGAGIYARGAAGVDRCSGGGPGAGGSGGAIRLIANTISGTFSLLFRAGSSPGCDGASGPSSPGFGRIEAFDFHNYSGNGDPNVISFALPFPVTQQNGPQLTITSVGGIAAPANPVGSFGGAPDIVVPASQPNPVAVALQANNIPVGTVVPVTVRPEAGTSSTVNSTALSGTEASSTATASVNLSSGLSVISAAVTIDLTTPSALLHPLFIQGERVDRIEVAAVYGGASETTYVTHSGRRIKRVLQ
jgi:hypothetical protein